MSKPFIFFGINDWVKGLYEVSKSMDDMNVAVFMVDDEYYNKSEFCGLPVWKYSSLNAEMTEKYSFLMCVGYRNMRRRQAIYDRLVKNGCRFVNYIHPTATILPDVQIGVNNIILVDVIFEYNAYIGSNNVFCSQTLISHDTIIGDHNFFSGRTALAGHCEVGDLCYFGFSSFSVGDLRIKNETYLVAGSGLFVNTKESKRYMGNPASVVGSHEENGICITRKMRLPLK